MRMPAYMVSLLVESVIRGYHVYKDLWDPRQGDTFNLHIEELNQHDRYAVAIRIKGDITAGHVPREILKIFYYFLRNNGTIHGEVTGRRQQSAVDDKGLEIPCKYKFTGSSRNVGRLQRLLSATAGEHNELTLRINT